LIYKLDKRLSLPAFVVGSMFPDLEIPTIILLFRDKIPNHLVLHSLLGAATIGTALSVLVTVLVYPPLVSSLFRIKKSKIERRCRLSAILVFSAFLGNISHVILDVAVHIENAIFWPLFSNIQSPVVSALGVQNSSLMIHALMGAIFLMLLIKERTNLFEGLLVE